MIGLKYFRFFPVSKKRLVSYLPGNLKLLLWIVIIRG
jgi:hypothetical protein